MKQYYRVTVIGTGNDREAREDVLFLEGQDPVVMAFRRNNALAGMNAIRIGAPEEAFVAGTLSNPNRVPTAREIKRRAREEAYRERINERFNRSLPRRTRINKEFDDQFSPKFGPGRTAKENG